MGSRLHADHWISLFLERPNSDFDPTILILRYQDPVLRLRLRFHRPLPSKHNSRHPRMQLYLPLLWLLFAPSGWAGMPSKLPSDVERGEMLYRRDCWGCHGAQALGDGPLATALPTPPPALAGKIPEQRFNEVISIILTGSGDMPGYTEVMDRYDARRILRWLATLDPDTGAAPPDGAAE